MDTNIQIQTFKENPSILKLKMTKTYLHRINLFLKIQQIIIQTSIKEINLKALIYSPTI